MDDDVESPMDVLGQPSANEGQYFSDRDARALIRDLLAGNPPNGIPLRCSVRIGMSSTI